VRVAYTHDDLIEQAIESKKSEELRDAKRQV
jgi:hypothetical protein